MARYCAECGSAKRMEGQPEGVVLCTVCNGQQPHPFDVVRQLAEQRGPRFTPLRGVYNTPETLGPGQGRGK